MNRVENEIGRVENEWRRHFGNWETNRVKERIKVLGEYGKQ